MGSSLDVANTTLRLSGVRAYEARRIICAFRKYDEEGVRELAQYSDNLDELVSHTRKRIQTLEELFENERTRVRHADVGWKTANSRAEGAAKCYPRDRLVLGSREEYVLR